MDTRVLKYNKISLKNFVLKDIVNIGKTNSMSIEYEDEIGKGPLMIQLPEEMRIPFDYNCYEKEITDKNGKTYNFKTYNLNINFNLDNEKHQICFKILKKLDEFFLNAIKNNSLKLFKKQPNFDNINNFSPLLSRSKDKNTMKYDDLYVGIRTKLPHKKNKIITKVYNQERKEINHEEFLRKGAIGGPIIKLDNIWASGTKYGVSCDLQLFKLQNEKVIEKPKKEFMFLSDSDSDD